MDLVFKVIKKVTERFESDLHDKNPIIPKNEAICYKEIRCNASAVLFIESVLDVENNTDKGFPTKMIDTCCIVNIAGTKYLVFGSPEEIDKMVTAAQPSFMKKS